MNAQRPEEIVDQHGDRLVHVVRRNMPARLQSRLDPEDVVQSVFRSFFRRRASGQYGDDAVHDVGRLLVTMTLNKVRNAVQHHQRQRRDVRQEKWTADCEVSPEPVPQDWGPEHQAMLAELVERMLDGLPAIHREIVLLRMAGHAVGEIAQRVRRSERTVIRVLTQLEGSMVEEVP